MEYKKYQQGDVVMLKVDDEYFEKNVRSNEHPVGYNTQSNNNPVLANRDDTRLNKVFYDIYSIILGFEGDNGGIWGTQQIDNGIFFSFLVAIHIPLWHWRNLLFFWCLYCLA